MPPDRAGAAVPESGGRRAGSAEAVDRIGHQAVRTPAPGVRHQALERVRLGLYTACLAIAMSLDIGVQGPAGGSAFWVCGCGALLCLIAGYVARGAAFRIGVVTALAFALAAPLGPAVASGLPAASVAYWPQVLVALFASRVLSEESRMRFARLWREPLRCAEPAAAQSVGAAVALGAALTLSFYQAMAWLDLRPAGGTGLAAIVTAALLGETLVHRSIVALFFVISAYLAEGAWLHLGDRMALGALKHETVRRQALGRGRTDHALDGPIVDLGEMRVALLVEAAYDGLDRPRPAASALRSAAFGTVLRGSRRFVRALLPVLPMLGFFGTVVGLATAMAALPTSSPEGGSVDISGSLSGLAVKFQTTLLGLLASLVASVLLALIENSEAELRAECALFAAALESERTDEP